MRKLLEQAGFPGIESDGTGADQAEGGGFWARLSASGPEFHAALVDSAQGLGWILSLCWPVRLDAPSIARWNEEHPGALLDVFGGETRLRLGVQSAADLDEWRRHAEAMIATCLGFRRAQRSRGEGM